MELQVYFKAEKERYIAPYFNLEEFACNCEYDDCTRTLINSRTLEKLNMVRKYFGKWITVTSAFRCQRYNTDVGGTIRSFHMLGSAVDLCPEDPTDIRELDRLQNLAEQYFDVVIRYANFIHCHMKE